MAPPPGDAEAEAHFDRVLVSEELIEGLRHEVDRLSFAAANLALPDARTRALFWPSLRIWDLGDPAPEGDASLAALQVTTRDLAIVGPRATSAPELALWESLLGRVDHFENTKFKIKQGRFLESADPDRPERFETKVKFSGLARMKTGELSWIGTVQKLRWRLLPGKDPEKPEHWRIEEWELVEAHRMDAAHALFEEVLDYAVPDPATRARARTNVAERQQAEELLAKRAGREYALPERYDLDRAGDRSEGLAVVDLDRDGFDDLYVTLRVGKNQFYRNRGDGSFEEIAAELGIDVDSYSTSALFADFDNDGDDDLFLGGSNRRSLYFENVGGRFEDRSKSALDDAGPSLVASLSAADYDGDGLLDVYAATYAAGRQRFEDLKGHLMPEVALEFAERKKEHHSYYDLAGPPNVLLHNEGGGRFREVEDPGDLASWRNTFQATWSDYDGDGDPDVYLSNDFAPDALIRNDGEGRFVDVTEEVGLTHLGFGMGNTWGDYDRDGRFDVYASNMYSTAGTRIADQLPWLDSRLVALSQGNYLYRQTEDGFAKVSERSPPGLLVQQTGWSWASQFADVDNDGFLDLAVLNGFYTAPPEVAIAGDT